jgi:hypothetical protein
MLEKPHTCHATHGTDARADVVLWALPMARLSHPNVVAVFDVGEHEGEVFLATTRSTRRDGGRDELLARAALAADEHRHGQVGHLHDLRADALDGLALAHHPERRLPRRGRPEQVKEQHHPLGQLEHDATLELWTGEVGVVHMTPAVRSLYSPHLTPDTPDWVAWLKAEVAAVRQGQGDGDQQRNTSLRQK